MTTLDIIIHLRGSLEDNSTSGSDYYTDVSKAGEKGDKGEYGRGRGGNAAHSVWEGLI